MTATLSAQDAFFRRLALFFGVLTSLLALQIVVAPAWGLPLTALALIICGMIIFMLAWPDLERDIVQFAVIGAMLGGVGEGIADGQTYFSLMGGMFGLIVGLLIGDEIQLSRKWYRLARQTREGNRWWQRPVATARWLKIGIGFICLGTLTMLVCVIIAAGVLPRSEDSLNMGEVLSHFHEQRLQSSTWKDIAAMWFVIIPLAMSLALSRLASRVPDQSLMVEGLMRRIGTLQCAALLMLAGATVYESILTMSNVGMSRTIGPYFNILDSFAAVARWCIFPLMLFMVSQLFLGKRLFRYWAHGGWLPALGLFALMNVFILDFSLVYVMTWMKP